jgi:hypothetical protein
MKQIIKEQLDSAVLEKINKHLKSKPIEMDFEDGDYGDAIKIVIKGVATILGIRFIQDKRLFKGEGYVADISANGTCAVYYHESIQNEGSLHKCGHICVSEYIGEQIFDYYGIRIEIFTFGQDSIKYDYKRKIYRA